MRKRRSVSLPQGLSWFVVCCVLLLAACDHSSGDTLKDPSPATGDNSISLQAPSPVSISPLENLSDDTLIPPEQPTLSLSAQTGMLNFQWQPVEGQIRARLYRHDPLLGGETLTHEFDDPTADNWQLPSQTHARAWHRQQYRVELCTLNDCVSSPRIPLSGLAPYTVESLSPAVFIEGERYAENIALNHTATLAVLTLPVEGALEIQGRIGEQWTLIQRLRLEALSVSTTRSLDVALSDSGDTLAIFIRDSNDPAGRSIRILERLGEAWVETAAWSVSGAVTVAEKIPADAQPVYEAPYNALTLSSNGEQVLLRYEQSLMHYRQTESKWSEVPLSLNLHGAQESQTPGTPAQLMASAQNAEFTRVFTLVQENQRLYLGIWTPAGDGASWQHRAHFPIQGLNPSEPLAIICDTAGSSVIVAGWEDSSVQDRAPVMWRYRIEPLSTEILTSAFSLGLTDSLRAPPTENANPELVFTADASLTLVALGWRSADDPNSTSTILPDAALSTYVYDSQTRQWLSALELPESLPTLAKQSFAAQIILSADGATMMMTSTAGNTYSSGIRVGEVLVMR